MLLISLLFYFSGQLDPKEFLKTVKVSLSLSLLAASSYQVLQCDAPYHGYPTNFFYELANQDMRILLTLQSPTGK